MWIRSAFFIGSPGAGAEEAFRAAIDDELVPAYRNFPGVRSTRACWPRRLEASPPAIACQLLIEFASEADIDLMLGCDERAALRPRTKEIAAMFDGVISHIDYEVGSTGL